MAYIFQTFQRNGRPHPRWRFEYRDRFGRKRQGTGYASKTETLKLATKVEADEEAIRKGYREAPKPSIASKDFKIALKEYLAWGDSQGGRGGRPWGRRHSLTRHRHLPWWQEKLRLRVLADLEGSLPRVEAELRTLQGQELAGRTVAQYAESLCAFCKWCVEREYLADNPLKKLSNFDTTPGTTRRALTHKEVDALLNAAPIERRFLYEVALCTGLRANELRNLTVGHLDTESCGVHLDPKWTKNRKPGFQPLPEDLVRRLADFVRTGLVGRKCERFYVRHDVQAPPRDALLYILSNPIKAFDVDLKAAGIQKLTREGRLDFHALRVTYATLVIESGASVKEAQTLLRHSTPDITMNTYARVRAGRLGELTEAVGKTLGTCVESAKVGHNGSSDGQILAPKEPQSPSEPKARSAISQLGSGSYEEKLMVEAAGIEPASESAST